MKKRYTFMFKNWLRFGLLTAFASIFSLDAFAQTAPAKIWDKTFGSTDIDHLYAGQQTKDGGYIIGGGSNSGIGGDKSQPHIGGNSDFWIVKMDRFGNKQWDKTYGSLDSEGIWCIKQTKDGGYIIGGSTHDLPISGDKTQSGYGLEDYWILKLDSNGIKQWDRTYGGAHDDHFRSLGQTSDGGYILSGVSNSGIGGSKSQPNKGNLTTWDYWVIKTDANGNKLWDKTIGGTGNEVFKELAVTADGGSILGGYSKSGMSGDKSQPAKGNYDCWIVKLDSLGSKQWDKTYGGTNNDFLWRIKQTSAGNYIVGAYSNSDANGDKSQPSKGAEDLWLLKLDPIGNKIWDKTYGTSLYDGIGDFVEDPTGGYLVSGYTVSGINGDKSQAAMGGADIWILKLDINGVKIWDQTYGGTDNDWPTDIYVESNGSFLIAGESMSGLSGDKSQACWGVTDQWVIKVGESPNGINESLLTQISLYPNPNQGKFILKLSNLTAPKAEVTVSDLLGRVVLQQELNVSNNQLSEELNLPNAKGMYLLQVKVGEQIITRKIVVE
ncbi:T9SS type A sorting domain-containing protein [Adhaeribacter terreus]|uniref:T9SS type A sorting domain-containing protein n=1 Tax=Adhaeribacter terreus TaxID=529703 RepID=A0ABW0E916_9BACT